MGDGFSGVIPISFPPARFYPLVHYPPKGSFSLQETGKTSARFLAVHGRVPRVYGANKKKVGDELEASKPPTLDHS